MSETDKAMRVRLNVRRASDLARIVECCRMLRILRNKRSDSAIRNAFEKVLAEHGATRLGWLFNELFELTASISNCPCRVDLEIVPEGGGK